MVIGGKTEYGLIVAAIGMFALVSGGYYMAIVGGDIFDNYLTFGSWHFGEVLFKLLSVYFFIYMFFVFSLFSLLSVYMCTKRLLGL